MFLRQCLVVVLALMLHDVSAQLRGELTLRGRVTDTAGAAVPFAGIQVSAAGRLFGGTVADDGGRFAVEQMPSGQYSLTVSSMGYEAQTLSVQMRADTSVVVVLAEAAHTVAEVLVTASEVQGITSASRIDRTAMNHLQPTSFSELLELLPGGKSTDPVSNKASLVKMREAGGGSEVMSSLGVQFVVDGAPMDADANLQYIPGDTDERQHANRGVDMRTIPTDDIDHIEVVRGIPSVEYGNLTSGLISIVRKHSARRPEARIKVDEYGKVFSGGWGLTLTPGAVLNLDVTYNDSKPDQRNSFENYKRASVSVRYNLERLLDAYRLTLGIGADYTGSFDNQKNDPEINVNSADSYRVRYQKAGFTSTAKWTATGSALCRSVALSLSATQAFDRIEQTKMVTLTSPTAIPNSPEAGEHDGEYLPYTYLTEITVDGKPLTANAKATVGLGAETGAVTHLMLLGAEASLRKNWGDGRVYDIDRPLKGVYTRPRAYSDIPAGIDWARFAEYSAVIATPLGKLTLKAGLRAAQLLNLADSYAMHGKVYVDDRENVRWQLPAIGRLRLSVDAGVGRHSKMPTVAMLYPDMNYVDVVQLNYFHNNPEYRRINLKTFVWDSTNHGLEPARNRKSELRINAEHAGHKLSVTCFAERMNDGFRNVKQWNLLDYKTYDGSTAPPDCKPELDDISYRLDTVINLYSVWANGLKVKKNGVEFQYSSPRLPSLHTRLTVSGAWFRTVTSNSGEQVMQPNTMIINGKPLGYVGVYDWEDGYERQSFGTNFMTDTHLEPLSLTVSLSMQCTWFTSSRPLRHDGVPTAYIDRSGTRHDYTEADLHHAERQWLVKTYAAGYFDKSTVPFCADINLKANKKIGSFIEMALFVNRMLSIAPDYRLHGMLIRRQNSPYFGMELNFRMTKQNKKQ